MNMALAFALGALFGAASVAACGWHLLRTAREAWHAAEAEEITAKARCEQLADQHGPGFVL